ncbi:MAG TPA: DUF3299 domain-containing protein [Desulfovibrio sp.]|uniref:DUF3299 domain-containing protein n=1 Tax=Desulfovibrio sp. TaxID=885 RepID=UPI002D6CE429|nr:DUF3299 domain-containing protein [Desulfovibrio sp.]HZF62493.1 DUF3299 domain-containing protein [Desulfovibrio sp.]
MNTASSTGRILCMLAALLCGLHSATALALTDDYERQKIEHWQPSREDADTAAAAKKSGKYTEITWDKLIPPSWNPAKVFDKFNFDKFSDDDPRADKALKEFQAMWSNAPANKALGGKLVRIAGFVAPLDFLGGDELAEFLLVPYFGACIHVPPPPANQIIYVTLDKPRGIQMMDTVWVYGKLEIEKTESDIGDAGYRIKAEAVEPYVEDENN